MLKTTELKRLSILEALTYPEQLRRGGWMTTSEVHSLMGSMSVWKVYAGWLDWMCKEGFVERRGKRRQYRITPAGDAERVRLRKLTS